MSSTSSRRQWLSQSLKLAAGVAVAPLLFSARAEAASADLQSKASVDYQDHPSDGDECSTCMHFRPGSSATAMGHCTVVAGAISPHGFCVAYAPKG